MHLFSSLFHIVILLLVISKITDANEVNSALFGDREVAGCAVFTKRVQTGILYLVLEPRWQSEWIFPKDCLKPGENASEVARRALKVTTTLTDKDVKRVSEEPIKPDEKSSYWPTILNDEHAPIVVPDRYTDYKWCTMEDLETFCDKPTIEAAKTINKYLLKSGY